MDILNKIWNQHKEINLNTEFAIFIDVNIGVSVSDSFEIYYTIFFMISPKLMKNSIICSNI